ncbi:MAG: N-6 DNA methylase [Solirubrobacterales bacterium]
MARPEDADLSSISRSWLAETPLAERKLRGQYLTPRPVAEALVDRVLLEPGMRVLDPGVGTGELLAAVARRCPEVDLTGWDIDPTALSAAARLVPAATLELRSALEPRHFGDPDAKTDDLRRPDISGSGNGVEKEFDLVIGNPPYFQVPVTPGLKARFGEVISGRANVFALFFKAGLDLLAPQGSLAYVVPPSMNSGAYFEALREHLVAHALITSLTLLEGTGLFEGANTAAQLLVLKKGSPQGSAQPFVFEHRDGEAGFRRVIFSRDPQQLEAGFEGRQTLWQLGYEAVTGTVVWNQQRDALSDQALPGSVRLVWSKDLRGGTLALDPATNDHNSTPPPIRERQSRSAGQGLSGKRPAYLTGRPALTGPALLVNRVVGSVGRGEIRTGLVPAGTPFLAENHVNVIRPKPGSVQQISWGDLQLRMSRPGVADRLRLLTGNTQISATELTHLLPV